MATRLVHAFVPDSAVGKMDALLETSPQVKAFRHNLPGSTTQYHILIPADQVASVLDPLQSAFGSYEDFRAVVLSVETVIPRLEEPETGEAAEETPPSQTGGSISREELIDDLTDVARLDPGHLWMVALSTVVATIGLATDNLAALIGAMVIAPLLGPNMALALACTLGDTRLARLSLRTSFAGVALAFALAALAGWLFDLDLGSQEILSRTDLQLGDLLLALAAGAAGALAFTTGVAASLVGVMVAVALLPPLVVCALTVTAGNWEMASGAAMLLAGNLVGVNLAAIATFLLRGVAPRTWWQKRKSRKLARNVFHGMVVFGPKMQDKQGFLFRVVDIAMELFAMAASASRAHAMARAGGDDADGAMQMADTFCRKGRSRINQIFRELWRNDDNAKVALSQSVLEGRLRWLEEGLSDLPQAPGKDDGGGQGESSDDPRASRDPIRVHARSLDVDPGGR